MVLEEGTVVIAESIPFWVSAALFIISFFFNTLVLWLVSRLYFRRKHVKYAIGIGFISALFELLSDFVSSPDLLVVNAVAAFVIDLILVKLFYRESWHKSALVTLAWFFLSILLGIILQKLYFGLGFAA